MRILQADDEDELEDMPDKPPNLEDFRRELDRFVEMYNECETIEPLSVFDKWLRVNQKPMKQALLNTVCKWSNLLKQHLINHVHKRYSELL